MQSPNRRTPSRHTVFSVFLVLVLGLTASLVQAQDVTGTWDLQMQASLSGGGGEEVGTGGEKGIAPPPGTCTYSGTAELEQSGGEFTGTATLNLATGDAECATMLTGTVDGEVNGGNIEMGMTVDNTNGTAEFSGTFGDPGERGAATELAFGTFNAVSGPYAGASGTWDGQLRGTPGGGPLDIPTAGGVGLLALALLLLGAGFFVLRR